MIRLFYLILTFIILSLNFESFSQDIDSCRVIGYVVEENTLERLPYATIKINDSILQADSIGRFCAFIKLSSKSKLLLNFNIEKDGYFPLIQNKS